VLKNKKKNNSFVFIFSIISIVNQASYIWIWIAIIKTDLPNRIAIGRNTGILGFGYIGSDDVVDEDPSQGFSQTKGKTSDGSQTAGNGSTLGQRVLQLPNLSGSQGAQSQMSC